MTEAQAHSDTLIPPLCQTLAELADPGVLSWGLRAADGRLVASVRVHADNRDPRVAHVYRLVVVPDRQGQGLGSSLLAAAEVRLPDQVRELQLFTGEHSIRNLRLYSRLGYVESHREAVPSGYCLVHLSKQRVDFAPVS